jgi:hypothetical protein
MTPTIPSPEAVLQAVIVFNSRYGAMESALWNLSLRARESLLAGETLETEVLVWTVRSWWGVQGAQRTTAAVAAEALRCVGLERSAFKESLGGGEEDEQECIRIISGVLATMKELGAPRMEFSLVSKALHWLMPWRMAPYDSFVRTSLGIRGSASPLDAYREIMAWQRKTCVSLLGAGDGWMGAIEPKAPFRALDKFLWYEGGGSANASVIVKHPESRIQKALAEASRGRSAARPAAGRER